MRADRIKGKFAHHGLLIVPVYLGVYQLEFMVDSGASYCVLAESEARKFGVAFDRKRTSRILIASKQPAFAPSAILPSLRIGGFSVQNLPVFIVEFHREMGVAGLLGMNFLRRFRFCIEPDSATLVLRNLRKP
jgi:clan AA aspartic protease (TIGR02281 family)